MYPARDVILSELSMLDEMLGHTGAEQVIERESLEARRQKVQNELNALPPARPLVSLTFKGDPVEGQRAIQADFGGKAAELFSGVVATVSAAVEAPLFNSGPIRGSKDRQLRIVGTAQGSFGFLLESPEASQTELALPGAIPRIDPVEVAVALLEAASDGNEEPFAEIVLKVPRVLTKLHSFVKHVTDRRATFAVEFGRHRAAIDSVEEGRAMLELLSGEVGESDQRVLLTVDGVFPNQRRFEARLAGAVIHGDLAPDLDAAAVQTAVGNELLSELRVREFRQSKRYTLVQLGVAPAD